MSQFNFNLYVMSASVKHTFIDGSKIIIEALAQSGADVFVGYPITPSNWLYRYAKERMPVFLPAPDEISTLQWMAGLSATGKVPVTSSAFPGIALMVESINMAFAMELPMVIVITQRMGPSTGSATTGAQGDLKLLNGIISGGFSVPVFSPSSFEDLWTLSNKAVETALKYRTPVFLLTSKEMVMYQKSFDISRLKPLPRHKHHRKITGEFKPYKPEENLTPAFVPLGDDEYLTRFTASTHDAEGNIRKADPAAMTNTKRLLEKFEQNIDDLFTYHLDETEGARKLIMTWGITSDAARDALKILRDKGENVDLFIPTTLLPVHDKIFDIISRYDHVVLAEENLTGQMKEILFGKNVPENIRSVNKMGSMITPGEIVDAVSNI